MKNKETKTVVVDGATLTSIPDFYRVKLWHKGEKEMYRFGIMDQYDEEAKKAWKKRQLIIEDAVFPRHYRVNVDEMEIQEIKDFPPTEYDEFVENHYAQAKETSNKVKGIGTGKLFGVGVGDGTAWYVITRVTKTNVTIEWRGYCGDRWTDRTLGWGGTFPRRCIEPHVRFEDFKSKTFPMVVAKQKKELTLK